MNAEDLLELAEEYSFAVRVWFKRVGVELEQRLRPAQSKGEIESELSLLEEVEAAIEVIRWHQSQASVALTNLFNEDETETTDASVDDRNNRQINSVLIGIDRSLLAWGRVQLFWPERAKEIMRFASLLAELRLWLERAFPAARDSIRTDEAVDTTWL